MKTPNTDLFDAAVNAAILSIAKVKNGDGTNNYDLAMVREFQRCISLANTKSTEFICEATGLSARREK